MSLHGDGREMFNAVVSHKPDTVDGQAAMSRLRAMATFLASYFNCCGTVEELLEALAAIRSMVEQATIEPPEDWQFFQMIVEGSISDHQYLFLNESTGRVLVVVPDIYTEEVLLEDVDDAAEENE